MWKVLKIGMASTTKLLKSVIIICTYLLDKRHFCGRASWRNFEPSPTYDGYLNWCSIVFRINFRKRRVAQFGISEIFIVAQSNFLDTLRHTEYILYWFCCKYTERSYNGCTQYVTLCPIVIEILKLFHLI